MILRLIYTTGQIIGFESFIRIPTIINITLLR